MISTFFFLTNIVEGSRIKGYGYSVCPTSWLCDFGKSQDTILLAESKEELKSLLMEVKEESEKAGLKLNIQKMKIMASGPITSGKIEEEKVEAVTDFIFLGSKITVDSDWSHEHLLLERKAMTNIDSMLKKQRHHFANKSPYSQGNGLSRSHTWIWELDHKEGRALKNWCFRTLVLEKTVESPLDCKEIKLVHPKGNQPWLFIGRTDVEAEAPILWPTDAKNLFTRKEPDAWKDWKQGDKRMAENEMVWWHHWLNGCESE